MSSDRPGWGDQPTRVEPATEEIVGAVVRSRDSAAPGARSGASSGASSSARPASAVSVSPDSSAAESSGPASSGVGPAPGAETELVGKAIGNYVIDRPLARGGMAVVYVARHPTLEREVAVKLLSEEYRDDRDLNRRFLREARVMSALRHPHVVEILDLGEVDGRAYYTMELLEGMDLAESLARRGRLDYRELAPYFSQIASALDAAHQRGIVHRDLKPANVFVVQREPLELKLMDFGIAKLTEGRHAAGTRRGEVLGTPAYMAPEQALGNVSQITPATDVYSLGVIAYEMLSGRLPFVAESDFLLLTMHVRDVPPRLAEVAPGVPASVVEVVERCLEKDPRDRPASAGELAAALRRTVLAAAEPPPSSRAEARARGIESMPPTEPPPAMEEPVEASARPGADEPPESRRPRSSVSRRPPPLRSEIDREPRTRGGRVTLAEQDARVIERVLRAMQRRADFPAFLNNVTEISRKADADGEYSACHLSEAILKDFALTAKLLRMVNTLYAARFGGKVYSINQAVVILGFDSVRAMALGVSVFKAPGKRAAKRRGAFDDDLADAAINSLISGEIARLLAPKAEIESAELAMMSAMFRNLGAQIVMEYLPEDYQKLVRLCETEGMTRADAAQKVLGTTLRRLGLGIAERWSLPRKLRAAISATPMPDDELRTEEDRLAALSQLSSDLCHIVATGDRAAWKPSVQRLLTRNHHLLHLDDKEVVALLGMVCKSFEARYSAVFGPHHRKSRFLQNARELSGEPPPEETPTPPKISEAEVARLNQIVTSVEEGWKARKPAAELLEPAVDALSSALAAPRLVVLEQSDDRHTLGVRLAVGRDAPSITAELSLPITRGADVFSSVLRSGRGQVVKDALAPSAMRRVPRRYFEVLGSAAFSLQPCASRGYPTALLLVDADEADRLPSKDRVVATKRLRELVARIIGRK